MMRPGWGPWLFALALAAACSESSLEIGYDDARAAGGSAGATGTGGAGPCVQATCQGKLYQCGDCIDNDSDGLIDAADPMCTGPCDNTEDSFFGGIPGQSGGGCRKDCYFDQDSGNGNDRCDWSFSCDRLSVAPSYPPSGDASCAYTSSASCAELEQTQDAACLSTCLPITPNGCDCFGCCELPARSGRYVWLGSELNNVGSCDLDHLDDKSACAPCTPVPSCFNRCEPCEACAGAAIPEANCGATPLCSVGVPCGPGASCEGTAYCITGCCIDIPR